MSWGSSTTLMAETPSGTSRRLLGSQSYPPPPSLQAPWGCFSSPPSAWAGSTTATHSSFKAQDPGQSRGAPRQKINLPNFPTISFAGCRRGPSRPPDGSRGYRRRSCPSLPLPNGPFFFFPFSKVLGLRHVACGILVLDQSSNLCPPAVEVWSLNYWTAREVPLLAPYPKSSNTLDKKVSKQQDFRKKRNGRGGAKAG